MTEKKKPEKKVEVEAKKVSIADYVYNTPRDKMAQMTRLPRGSLLLMSCFDGVVKNIGNNKVDLQSELIHSICSYARSVPLKGGEGNTLLDIMATLAAEEAPEEDEGKTIRPL
jgi:hypothetical protein